MVFPTGLACDLQESGNPEAPGTIHLFGELYLPLADTRDGAYARAMAWRCGFRVRKVGGDRIEVWDHDTGEYILIAYDDALGRMVDLHAARDDAP